MTDVNIKISDEEDELIDQARKVYLKHNPNNDGLKLSKRFIIRRSLVYYIEK